MWCLRRHCSQHVSNAEVRRRTGCTPLSETIRSRWLCLFGHIARAGPEMNHCRALKSRHESIVTVGGVLDGVNNYENIALTKMIMFNPCAWE